MVQSPQSSGPVLPIHHCQCLTFIKKCAYSVKKSSALNGRRRTEMDDTYNSRHKFLYHSRREFSMPELTRWVWEIRVFARHGWHLVLKFVPNPRMETEARKQMGIPNWSYGPGLARFGTKLLQTCKLNSDLYIPSQNNLRNTALSKFSHAIANQKVQGHKNLLESLSSLPVLRCQFCAPQSVSIQTA